jgi:hypothetical protein
VVEVQRDASGRPTGAVHLPLGSAMQFEDASGAIVGVKPRAEGA